MTGKPIDLLGVDQVTARIGLKKSWLYSAIAEGQFPRPVTIPGTRRALWASNAVDQWIAEKTAAAPAQPQAPKSKIVTSSRYLGGPK